MLWGTSGSGLKTSLMVCLGSRPWLCTMTLVGHVLMVSTILSWYVCLWNTKRIQFVGSLPYQNTCLLSALSHPVHEASCLSFQGGSWISTGDLASRFARFAFRRHFMQHCGFRIVRPAEDKLQEQPICIINTPIYVQNHGIIGNICDM